ncbi:TetR/AcrR family transcriptional regulator [Acidipila sp. EB88]|uniref:TetR/AcrR family transcriptional regulator n=1 Tax=Acidipila sp. EB88 TaxID=2305226 RepID=UPI000F5E68F8|nr:TetR/AcrR family transcriptional regulator [Acidipila sp. EB88]RRA49065.1 TetR/AcrR family transcriptional regulator [Acidipila sp. EB88]
MMDRGTRKTEQIVAAARELFLKDGYANVSTDAVARQAGVSKATMYVRYASKEQLFEAVLAEEMTRIFLTTDLLLKEDLPLEEALFRYGSGLYELVSSKDHLLLYRMVCEESRRFPHVGAAYYARGPKRGIRHLAAYLAAHLQSEHRDPQVAEAMAEDFFSLVTGKLLRQEAAGVRSRRKSTEQAAVKRSIELFMKGYKDVLA